MEEVFGSRSSLGVENPAGSSEENLEEDSDGENILGSLNGLKRWTTEENLCVEVRGDGGVVEFSTAPIHDSHSNSTGNKTYIFIALFFNFHARKKVNFYLFNVLGPFFVSVLLLLLLLLLLSLTPD